MSSDISSKYNQLLKKLEITDAGNDRKVNQVIRNSLHEFCSQCKNPAIWCMGKHTRMLMGEFMNELKKVHFIVDKKQKNAENVGFHIIGSEDLEKNDIDGVIISSYVYKDEIKKELKGMPGIKYLDLYEKLEDEGIILRSSYFSSSHPHSRYKVINQLQRSLRTTDDKKQIDTLIRKIIAEYVIIKDFRSAVKYAEKLVDESHKQEDKTLLNEIQEIYDLQIKMMKTINDNNVLMLCIDGLRRKDLIGRKLPDVMNWMHDNTLFYTNAYSSSTSTYESLIPVYSENNNLKTKYYDASQIPEQNCSFVAEALKQKRNIFFYTDSDFYVDTDQIIRSGSSQTATEKMWDFMLDANSTKNGLFYVHIVFESHYSYPNPYTKGPIVADGSSIMFDFIETKGGKLRTDYVTQQGDALMYLNDVLTPLLSQISCSMVLYADHGNILMGPSDKLEDLDRTKFTYHDDLIQIPIAIKSPETENGENDSLISLMELNKIIISLMNHQKYVHTQKSYIKVQRSQIYNPDFCYIYHKYGYDRELQAFEYFIFEDNYRLAVYADGNTELYNGSDLVNDELCKTKYISCVKKDITVCNL